VRRLQPSNCNELVDLQGPELVYIVPIHLELEYSLFAMASAQQKLELSIVFHTSNQTTAFSNIYFAVCQVLNSAIHTI
jgi:hypothetical protein